MAGTLTLSTATGPDQDIIKPLRQRDIRPQALPTVEGLQDVLSS